MWALSVNLPRYYNRLILSDSNYPDGRFNYDAKTVTESVGLSLEKLRFSYLLHSLFDLLRRISYLDMITVHDIEFASSCVI